MPLPFAPRPTLTRTLALIAGLWLASDFGFYLLLPWLGVDPGYSDGPLAIALYYVWWIGTAVILLWPVLATWPDHARWPTFRHPWASLAGWTLFFAGAIAFATLVLPALPPFLAPGSRQPPDLPLADPWYFLPKSADILFQQVLVCALVLALAGAGLTLRRMALLTALLFGASHLLLLLGESPAGYVLRFTIAATVFGALFPALILRVPNGLALAYAVQWSYYAVALVAARLG